MTTSARTTRVRRPLSKTDEARARIAVETPAGPFDDSIPFRDLPAQALATIDVLRGGTSKLTPNSSKGAEQLELEGSGYTWTERDVAFELDCAERIDGQRDPSLDPLGLDQPRLDAFWHRLRARAIEALIQARDACEEWYPADCLDAVPSRRARFHDGPFDDGRERTVADPPNIVWVASRAGAGDPVYVIREVGGAFKESSRPLAIRRRDHRFFLRGTTLCFAGTSLEMLLRADEPKAESDTRSPWDEAVFVASVRDRLRASGVGHSVRAIAREVDSSAGRAGDLLKSSTRFRTSPYLRSGMIPKLSTTLQPSLMPRESVARGSLNCRSAH